MSEQNTMWALVKAEAAPGLALKKVPVPEVGTNDVKIKIHKTAICGTDVHKMCIRDRCRIDAACLGPLSI